jgi:hypothetical protein
MGELIKTLHGDLSQGTTTGIVWDLKVMKDQYASRGLYVCVLDTKNAAGYLNRKIQKLAISENKP